MDGWIDGPISRGGPKGLKNGSVPLRSPWFAWRGVGVAPGKGEQSHVGPKHGLSGTGGLPSKRALPLGRQAYTSPSSRVWVFDPWFFHVGRHKVTTTLPPPG